MLRVTFLCRTPTGGRFRIVGEPEAENWKRLARPDREPWCEVDVVANGKVTSFGGELWPSAWPSLFNVEKYVSLGTTLTVKGRQTFNAALREKALSG